MRNDISDTYMINTVKRMSTKKKRKMFEMSTTKKEKKLYSVVCTLFDKTDKSMANSW